jgi:adenylate kinase
MLNVVIFGPPGAGKGTQSEKLIEKYGFVHISTGDMFRAHIKNQTPLGKKVIEYTDNGILVPDSITIDMLQEEVNANPQAQGFLFDGFPRTVPQAEALDALMEKNGSAIHAVVALEVTEAEVRARISKRRELSGRADDEDDKVNKRIDEYFNKTIHVLPFYDEQGRLERVNGIGDIDEIFENICQALS